MTAFPLTKRLLSKPLRLRLIPAVAAVITLAAGIRVGEVGTDVAIALGVSKAGAQAQTNAKSQASPKDGPIPLLPQDKGKGVPSAQPTSPGSRDLPPPEQSSIPPNDSTSTSVAARDPATFSKSELELLQNLAERREMIEARARDIDLREAALSATARQVDEKVNELKAIEARITALLKQRDEQEEQSLRSLVKVYENMKPVDAGRIFEQLEMPILLDVVERMKETKIASVLAGMNPQKAKAITEELAARRQIPSAVNGKSGTSPKASAKSG